MTTTNETISPSPKLTDRTQVVVCWDLPGEREEERELFSGTTDGDWVGNFGLSLTADILEGHAREGRATFL